MPDKIIANTRLGKSELKKGRSSPLVYAISESLMIHDTLLGISSNKRLIGPIKDYNISILLDRAETRVGILVQMIQDIREEIENELEKD